MTCSVPGAPAPVFGDISGDLPFLLSPVNCAVQPHCLHSLSPVTFQVM